MLNIPLSLFCDEVVFVQGSIENLFVCHTVHLQMVNSERELSVNCEYFHKTLSGKANYFPVGTLRKEKDKNGPLRFISINAKYLMSLSYHLALHKCKYAVAFR